MADGVQVFRPVRREIKGKFSRRVMVAAQHLRAGLDQSKYTVDVETYERMRALYEKVRDNAEIGDVELERAELALIARLGVVNSTFVATKALQGIANVRKARVDRLTLAVRERAQKTREEELDRDKRLRELEATVLDMAAKLEAATTRKSRAVSSPNDLGQNGAIGSAAT